MRNSTLQHFRSLILFLLFALSGCNDKSTPPPKPQTRLPTIASLVPSATDLLIDMGAADHLVAVSNYDVDPRASALPKVGDYESIDWEKISELHPQVLITDYAPSRTPAGMVERLNQLHIRGLNVKFARRTDVFDAIKTLGDASGEPAKGDEELRKLRDGMETVQKSVAGQPRIKALIVTGSPRSDADIAGRDTYLDDLLNAAGGENAIASAGYPSLDREAIAALKPQVILQLIPDGDDATKAKTRAFWDAFPDLPAVKEHRLWIFTQPYIMMPGAHIPQVAAMFAAALHPRPSTSQPFP